MNAHEIDYEIFGEEMQYVEIELDPQEAVVAEAGSFMMMETDIKMNTIFGDGSNQDNSVLGKIFSAGKRMLTGESLLVSNMGLKPCNLLQHFSNAKNYIFTLWVIINVKVHIL